MGGVVANLLTIFPNLTFTTSYFFYLWRNITSNIRGVKKIDTNLISIFSIFKRFSLDFFNTLYISKFEVFNICIFFKLYNSFQKVG